MLSELSAVIITRNAAGTLARTLDSLEALGEVVVYDNGSTDETLDIARRYANVSLHQGEFFGFGPTKRHAVSLARHDWILSLDADEAPTIRWLESLAGWLLTADPDVVVEVLRENWLLGKPVHHSGWGNDWLVRVFHRQRHNFNDAMVHESVAVSPTTQVVRLDGCLEHLAVTELGQFLDKINRYSTIRAQSDTLRVYPVGIILLKSIFAFLRTYLLRRGFLDGWRGLVIAVANANGVFWKYMKRRVRDI
ncbi:Glycosyl transferase family 2 [Halomonas shengliensis]|uniref:Glycosyl transferase family 2 n=1 Tax=Halomonas shengliensis TaxID=419597 RepID=A0A1H0FJW9_9GAMM|nr:glycosyltransferase family 2 protein [Halomonas shengliensis]SDN94900.1 Glycosyl transferase family 2 [Halomonas shengliensis]